MSVDALPPRPARAASPGLVLGAALSAVFVVMALVGLVWTPHDAAVLDVSQRLQGPSGAHPFGTDHLGRDVLSLIVAGAWNSLAVSLVAVGIGIAAGVPLGLWAAAQGGWADEVLGRVNDIVFAFPAILLAVMITAAAGPGALNAIVAIGIFNIPVFARVARGSALPLWRREFVLAARVAGKGRLRISAEHILPNISSQLIVQGTIQFALGILAEAGLSYVGLGAQPPAASWGRMLNEAQTFYAAAPWLVIAPGLAIVLAVLGLSLLGDAARDLLDPRLRRR